MLARLYLNVGRRLELPLIHSREEISESVYPMGILINALKIVTIKFQASSISLSLFSCFLI